jgi:hypothetical protein
MDRVLGLAGGELFRTSWKVLRTLEERRLALRFVAAPPGSRS